MNFKNALFLMAWFAVILLGNSCHISGELCLAPPPNFDFVLLDKNGKELISQNNNDSVKIFSTDGPSIKNFVPSVTVRIDSTNNASNPPFHAFVNAYAIFYQSFGSNDPVFNIEVSGSVVGKIQLKTFQHKEKCNGWHDASEIRFNDKVILHDNFTSFFTFKTE